MLHAIVVFFHVIACLTLILAILLQVGRGHGLSGASFSQSGVQTVFGTKTADFLTKATTVMAILFVITCISLDVMYSRKSKSLFAPGADSMSKADMEKIKQVLEKIKAEQAAQGPSKGETPEKSPAAVAEKPVSSPPASGPATTKSNPATTSSPLPPKPSSQGG